jgi:hypothetical protein
MVISLEVDLYVDFLRLGICCQGISMCIVDQDQVSVPTNELGAPQVVGPSVFTEYYQNPAATVEAFTIDGWFMTGDRSRIDTSTSCCAPTSTRALEEITVRQSFEASPCCDLHERETYIYIEDHLKVEKSSEDLVKHVALQSELGRVIVYCITDAFPWSECAIRHKSIRPRRASEASCGWRPVRISAIEATSLPIHAGIHLPARRLL